MKQQHTWSLGTALAIIDRGNGALRVRVQGVVTAMAFEALHLRLATESATRRELLLDHDALLVMTCRSAVDAALRGTPAGHGGLVHVGVPLTRLAWALEHCLLMTRQGQPRMAFALDRRAPAGA